MVERSKGDKLVKLTSPPPSSSSSSCSSMDDTVFSCMLPYVHDPCDRSVISLVCRRWYELDCLTRKNITIAICYSTTPHQLRRRFPNIESLKLKGKPRAAMFNLMPENWGGHVAPWVHEIAVYFNSLRHLHFRRMIVTDSDLELLAAGHGRLFLSLKLDKCSDFSTDGLLHVTRNCRQLTTLFLEESTITEKDGEWLHELAMNNVVLETLNFYGTELSKVRIKDIQLIAQNCRFLVSLKISDCEILDLSASLRTAASLEEFCGGSFNYPPESYSAVTLPSKLWSLGLSYLSKEVMSMVLPVTSRLTKLNLLFALLDTDDHCSLLPHCPNLQVLETRAVIADAGLRVMANSCRRLRRLRVERGADEDATGDEGGSVTEAGLIDVAHGCLLLEYLAVYVLDVTNLALVSFGTFSKKLRDFRIVLLERDGPGRLEDRPLDDGVRALLRGCKELERLALYLRHNSLTNMGMGYIGQYAVNVRWMLLGFVGESDAGIFALSRGCPRLQRLEMRNCPFTETGLSSAVVRLPSLRYLWVQGCVHECGGRGFLKMVRPFWNIEFIPFRRIHPSPLPGQTQATVLPTQVFAYYSLAGQRTDFPLEALPFEFLFQEDD